MGVLGGWQEEGKGRSELEFGFGHDGFKMPKVVQSLEDASHKVGSES